MLFMLLNRAQELAVVSTCYLCSVWTPDGGWSIDLYTVWRRAKGMLASYSEWLMLWLTVCQKVEKSKIYLH